MSCAICALGFIIGRVMLNRMFRISRLAPHWRVGWGIVTALVPGTLSVTALSVTALFAAVPDALAVASIALRAVQEMVRAAGPS